MPPLVDAYSSLLHYGDHVLPIWEALEPAERGLWYAPPRTRPHLARLGVANAEIAKVGRPGKVLRPCIVASAGDQQVVGRRPVIFVEHGAGQAYEVDHPSYSGGSQRDTAVLFLCPNDVVAARNRATYPDTPAVVVGSPRVESLVRRSTAGNRPAPLAEGRAVLALSFHWDARFTPEARWAFPHYEAVLPQIVSQFDVIGHGHPRFDHFFRQLWVRLGVEYVEQFSEVVARAAVYVCDNSSTQYEWAALDRPVVVLNAPWYRRNVDLWPRFWAHADVGLNVDQPHELVPTIERALADPPEAQRGRQRAVAAIWGEVEGAAKRAADTIRGTVASLS